MQSLGTSEKAILFFSYRGGGTGHWIEQYFHLVFKGLDKLQRAHTTPPAPSWRHVLLQTTTFTLHPVLQAMPHRNSWEHFSSQGVEILNYKGHVTQSLRTTGLPIANIFCPLISRGLKTRGLKVTSPNIGLSNQNPNNVAINKIWAGIEWSVPPLP